MNKSFYEAETSEEAVFLYFKNYGDQYSCVREAVLKKVLFNLCEKNDFKSLKILEIGAGGGFWTEFFLKHGANVTCVDPLEKILNGNRELHPQAKFILGDATTINFHEEYDLIFVKDVIEHIEDDEGFLNNMNKHLKASGFIIITTQNSCSLNYLIQGAIWNFFIKKNKRWCGWDPTHLRFYTPRSLKTKLQKAMFETKKWFSCYHFPYKIITRRLSFGKRLEFKIFHLIETIGLYDKFPFNFTGWSIGVVARKFSSQPK